MTKKQKQREKCSYLKGHDAPSKDSYQQDLLNWWLEYACGDDKFDEGEYKTPVDIMSAIMRLRDYMGDDPEQGYGFSKDLTSDSKFRIIEAMLWKVQKALANLANMER
jgi:hypothetical protein